MGLLQRTLGFGRLVILIVLYGVRIAAALVSIIFATPAIVIGALASAMLSAGGLAFTITQLGIRFLNVVIDVLVIGTYYYVTTVLGPLRLIVLQATRGSLDIAVEAQNVARVLGTVFKVILLIGAVVGALTWVPEQSEIQNAIDLVGCQIYPYLKPFIDRINLIITFYNFIAEPLNVLGNILFEFAEDVFLAFLDLVLEGVILIFRFVADSAGSLQNCTVFLPGQAAPPLCPNTTGGNFGSATVCVVEELFCWALRVLDFIIVDVLERFLRILFPPIIADSVTNVLEALAETFLMFVDVFAATFSNPINGLPFVGCSGALPTAAVSNPQAARACFNNRNQCPQQRLICNAFYWLRIVFSSAFNLLEVAADVLDGFLAAVFPSFGGQGIFTRFLEFLGIIDRALDIITNFASIVNGLIKIITDPIDAAVKSVTFAFNFFRDSIIGDPLGTLSRLPRQLLSAGNVLGRQLGFLLEFIERVEGITVVLDRAIGVLRSIVNAISSGGGLFGRRRLLGIDHEGIPLNPPSEWFVEFENQIGIYNLSSDVGYSLLEIMNNTLQPNCNVDPDTAVRLQSRMDWIPDIHNLGKEEMTPEQADVVRYMLTRHHCAKGELDIRSPEYHLATMSPRLNTSHVCYNVLGNEAIRHVLAQDTSSEWWTEWYLPCTITYIPSFHPNGTLADYTWFYMAENEPDRSSLVGLIKLEQMKRSWHNVFGGPSESVPPSVQLAGDEMKDAKPKHLFEKSRHELTPHENKQIDREFFEHVTRPRGMHKAQEKIDRARAALSAPRNKTRRPTPEWGLSWAKLRWNSTYKADTLSTALRGRTSLNARRILQVAAARTFNFTDDVLRPISEQIRKFFTALLLVVIKFLRGIGAVPYALFLEAVIEFMRTYELQVAITFLRSIVVNFFDTIVDQFQCDYNVIDNPSGEWTLGCLSRLQFPPSIPLLPEDSQSFLIQWPTPCSGPLQQCQYTALIPSTGLFFDDLLAAVLIRPTEAQCPAGFRSCSTLGFTDQFDFAIYTLELSTEDVNVDVIGFFRSSLYSTLTVFEANFIGLTLLPARFLPLVGNLLSPEILADWRTATELGDVRPIGEIVNRFNFDTGLPRSDFHDFCVVWGFGLIPGAILFIVFVLIVQVLFLVRVVPITTRLVGFIGNLLVPPFFIFREADDILVQETLEKTVIVRKQTSVM